MPLWVTITLIVLGYCVFVWLITRVFEFVTRSENEQRIVVQELYKNAGRYPTLEEFGDFVRPERLDEE